MADPLLVDCLAGQWTLVAAAVTAGNIYRKSTRPGGYLQTYRMAGGSAPTDVEEGAQAFDSGDLVFIESSERIDVYLYAQVQDGKVRVDV